jgi:hypothetical protein
MCWTSRFLFVLGRQNHRPGYRDAWRILENCSRATFAVVDGVGHAVCAEEKALFGAWSELAGSGRAVDADQTAW